MNAVLTQELCQCIMTLSVGMLHLAQNTTVRLILGKGSHRMYIAAENKVYQGKR